MVNAVVTGTPYSCVADLAYLQSQKATIDYHTKYMGNSTKSTITPAELEKLKREYDVAKSRYDASDCNKDPDRDTCISYQTQIANLRSAITYSINTRDSEHANVLKGRLDELIKKYKDLNCDAKISEFRGGVVMSIADIYQQMDKERIEAENKYQLKQRIFFGGIVVFGALLMITMFGKKS